jgi:hypothetical protein
VKAIPGSDLLGLGVEVDKGLSQLFDHAVHQVIDAQAINKGAYVFSGYYDGFQAFSLAQTGAFLSISNR